MPRYIVHFAQFHSEFRLPELESLAVLESIDLKYENYIDECPFLIIELNSNADAIKLIQRSILVKEIAELWASGNTQTEMFEEMKNGHEKDRPMYKTCSFKFLVSAFGFSLSIPEQIKRIEACSWMGCQGKQILKIGPIDMKNPDVTFCYYEDYHGETNFGKKLTIPPKKLYFGVLLATGNRTIVSQYDLKKRDYLGTTSMDAELSLIMANQALARPGTMVLDPFVGTGSFLVSCSHFGAYTIGSDIDGRQIRGSLGTNSGGILKNVKQYNLESLVLGTLVCDISIYF
jgi:tRNA (guanine10-N2)-methyltransferase